MKGKWYFATLILILALFGICHQQVVVPNQEIVVQFSDNEVSSDKAQNAVEVVKLQLLAIGAKNIQVRPIDGGKLKITYYSDADVASIEAQLSTDKALQFNHVSFDQSRTPQEFPIDGDSNHYDLDVYEIQSDQDGEKGLGGITVVEMKLEGDRFFNPSVYLTSDEIEDDNRITEVAFKVFTNIASTIDKISYKIPEVRAGPDSKGIQYFS